MKYYWLGIWICLSGAVCSQSNVPAHRVSYKIYECLEFCKRDTVYADFKNGALTFSYGVYESCSNKPDSVFVDVQNDSVLVYTHTPGKNFVKNPKSRPGPSVEDIYCLCYYKIDVSIENLLHKPVYYEMEDAVFTDKYGFMAKDWYNRIRNKELVNNSAGFSLEQLQELKEQSIGHTGFRNGFKLLGNDSITENRISGSRIEYDQDGIVFLFGDKDRIAQIEISPWFKGKLYAGVKWTENKQKIERKTGAALNTQELYGFVYDGNGNETKIISGYICLYKVKGLVFKIRYGSDFLPQHIDYLF